jgi:hypothetical protein
MRSSSGGSTRRVAHAERLARSNAERRRLVGQAIFVVLPPQCLQRRNHLGLARGFAGVGVGTKLASATEPHHDPGREVSVDDPQHHHLDRARSRDEHRRPTILGPM